MSSFSSSLSNLFFGKFFDLMLFLVYLLSILIMVTVFQVKSLMNNMHLNLRASRKYSFLFLKQYIS